MVSTIPLPFCRCRYENSAFWSLFKRRQRRQRKDVSTNSVLTRNGNGSTATEWWKLGIREGRHRLVPDVIIDANNVGYGRQTVDAEF